MSSQFKNFDALHRSDQLFVLPNVWNAKSALLFQKEEIPAVGTSSAAVAESLGYRDGEEMPFAEYLFMIKRILSAIKIPLSVDIEMGYGKTSDEIFSNIQRLLDLGVAGINIEDSVIEESKRSLQNARSFAKTLEYIKGKLGSTRSSLFINVRCDTYILNVANKRKETIERVKIYEASGADGIFLPCISNEEDITEAVDATRLPLNVMCIPGLPGFETLNKLGVKRVSMGPFLFNKVYHGISDFSKAIVNDNSFSPILS
jgi:2-methylisocitrate lyase-like PEP mutase family enzyme